MQQQYLQQSNNEEDQQMQQQQHSASAHDQKAEAASGARHQQMAPTTATAQAHHMPIVQLEISADGFEVTQNSVKFLPHGIQFSVGLPPCKKCSQQSLSNKFGRSASGDAAVAHANGDVAEEPEQLKDSTGSDHQQVASLLQQAKQNEIKFLLKLSNEHTESQFSHIARQTSIPRSTESISMTKSSTPGAATLQSGFVPPTISHGVGNPPPSSSTTIHNNLKEIEGAPRRSTLTVANPNPSTISSTKQEEQQITTKDAAQAAGPGGLCPPQTNTTINKTRVGSHKTSAAAGTSMSHHQAAPAASVQSNNAAASAISNNTGPQLIEQFRSYLSNHSSGSGTNHQEISGVVQQSHKAGTSNKFGLEEALLSSLVAAQAAAEDAPPPSVTGADRSANGANTNASKMQQQLSNMLPDAIKAALINSNTPASSTAIAAAASASSATAAASGGDLQQQLSKLIAANSIFFSATGASATNAQSNNKSSANPATNPTKLSVPSTSGPPTLSKAAALFSQFQKQYQSAAAQQSAFHHHAQQQHHLLQQHQHGHAPQQHQQVQDAAETSQTIQNHQRHQQQAHKTTAKPGAQHHPHVLSSSEQFLSRLVNGHHQHPQLGPSATNPAALNIAAGAKSTPTTSSLMLVEALRAANLADNPTNLLVDRSQNGGQQVVPAGGGSAFSNLNQRGVGVVVVKSALGSSVEEASGISPADSSVSQSHSPLTHQTIYNDRNEDAEMRVSMKGGSLDGVRGGAVRGAVASGSMRHNHHHGQMVMPARPSNSSSLTRRAAAAGHHHRLQQSSRQQQLHQEQRQGSRRREEGARQCGRPTAHRVAAAGDHEDNDQSMQSNGEDDEELQGQQQEESNDDDEDEEDRAENATTKEVVDHQFKLLRGSVNGGGVPAGMVGTHLHQLQHQGIHQHLQAQSQLRRQLLEQQQQEMLAHQQHQQASYEPAGEKGSALQGVDLIAQTLDNHHHGNNFLRGTYQDLTPSSTSNHQQNQQQEISSSGNSHQDSSDEVVEGMVTTWGPQPAVDDCANNNFNQEQQHHHSRGDNSVSAGQDVIEDEIVDPSSSSFLDEEERKMLYQPFDKDEMLVMPDLSSSRKGSMPKYAEGFLTIEPNPLLNPLTYCVSNKDYHHRLNSNSLKNNKIAAVQPAAALQSKGNQTKHDGVNKSSNIRNKNSSNSNKKTKQSSQQVKKVATSKHQQQQPQPSSASEKVRKSAAQAKAAGIQNLTSCSSKNRQQLTQQQTVKQAKKPISKKIGEPLKVATLKRKIGKSQQSMQHKLQKQENDASLKEGLQKAQKNDKDEQEDTTTQQQQLKDIQNESEKVAVNGSGLKVEHLEAEADSNLKYQCKICLKRFLHSSALGGHISKAHPGQSRAYNHKKRVRETRELERELHRHTMQVYQETLVASQGAPPNTSLEALEAAGHHPTELTPTESTVAANLAAKAMALTGRSASKTNAGSGSSQNQQQQQQQSQQLNRNTIKRIKKMLVMQDDQYQSLRCKFLGQHTNTSISSAPGVASQSATTGCKKQVNIQTSSGMPPLIQQQEAAGCDSRSCFADEVNNYVDDGDDVDQPMTEQVKDIVVGAAAARISDCDDQVSDTTRRGGNPADLQLKEQQSESVSKEADTLMNKNKSSQGRGASSATRNVSQLCNNKATSSFKKISSSLAQFTDAEQQERLRLQITQNVMQQIGQDRLRKQAMGSSQPLYHQAANTAAANEDSSSTKKGAATSITAAATRPK